jgi:hypothetical protein
MAVHYQVSNAIYSELEDKESIGVMHSVAEDDSIENIDTVYIYTEGKKPLLCRQYGNKKGVSPYTLALQ